MKVIDSSILVKYFSREKGWEKAREYIIEGGITLDLAIKELANALWKKTLNKEISSKLAVEAVKDLISEKPVVIEDELEYLPKALEYAIKYGITVYDALFIVLASAKKLDLVTADRKQAEAAARSGVNVVLI